MQDQQLRELERSSYYAVVRALYACGRLETFENELLLTDLQETLNIGLDEHLAYLQQVAKDVEATQLAHFGQAAPAAPAAPARVAEAPRPVAQPPPLIVPQYDSPFHHTPTAPMPSKSKAKKGSTTAPPASGGIAKQSSFKKTKSVANTPSTPRSQQAKGGAVRSGEKRLVGAAAAAVAAAQQKAYDKALADLDRLNAREREIFEALIHMGVSEDDPDLNDVHRTLLKWYRLDMRQRQIEQELGTMIQA